MSQAVKDLSMSMEWQKFLLLKRFCLSTCSQSNQAFCLLFSNCSLLTPASFCSIANVENARQSKIQRLHEKMQTEVNSCRFTLDSMYKKYFNFNNYPFYDSNTLTLEVNKVRQKNHFVSKHSLPIAHWSKRTNHQCSEVTPHSKSHKSHSPSALPTFPAEEPCKYLITHVTLKNEFLLNRADGLYWSPMMIKNLQQN